MSFFLVPLQPILLLHILHVSLLLNLPNLLEICPIFLPLNLQNIPLVLPLRNDSTPMPNSLVPFLSYINRIISLARNLNLILRLTLLLMTKGIVKGSLIFCLLLGILLQSGWQASICPYRLNDFLSMEFLGFGLWPDYLCFADID